MAKVAAAPSSLSNGSGALKINLRAPTDINVEQLKSKPDTSKNTRLDEVYTCVKPSSRMRLLSLKSNGKLNEGKPTVGESFRSKSSSLPPNLNPRCDEEVNSNDDIAGSTMNAKDNASQQCPTTEKCKETRFLSVNELSQGRSDWISRAVIVDMDKALKGFAARGPSNSDLPADSLAKSGALRSAFPGVKCPDFHLSGKKIPLDLSLKTTMRLVSSSPISWFHRLVMSCTYNGMAPFPTQFCNNHNSSGVSNTFMATGNNALTHLSSWIYPHSSLPSSLIAALNCGTGGETEFLIKRQLDWEESFRNLYYMLRKNACDIFYVCTSQFVVMFTAIGAGGKTKRKCNAYISQSTRGLRSLLREHDVQFSMPLCLSDEEQTSREDLVELSEIEKHNLGQTKRRCLLSDLNNRSESLLAFHGNESIHGLYDFLLNYKYFLNSLNGADVPVLCAPLPFRNAAPSAPEVRCKEIKTDHLASQSNGSVRKDDKHFDVSSGGTCYSIEIKDAYIAPWVIGSLCTAMASEGKSFEASFNVEPNSLSLNVALDAIKQSIDAQDPSGRSQESYQPLGMTAAVLSELRSSWIKVLKCCDGSYTASLTQV